MPVEVVQLNTRLSATQQRVVAELEEILERARQGEFDGFAWVASRLDNSVATSWTQSEDWHRLVAGIATLQWRMIEQREV